MKTKIEYRVILFHRSNQRFRPFPRHQPALERTALNRRIAGRTQIVVTQRITSAMSADCIFVMDGGCLVDSGTHDELLVRCRIYREIYASQTGGDLQ